ncbi:MAG: 30S ribosomal protein S6 [Armatimonadetes bacterium]|nr:30S ribosomal protein S6 [Armatimonadota bacterium]MDW8154640.1 30S ribosomal protein S6 [Armatimonadota bacterium]
MQQTPTAAAPGARRAPREYELVFVLRPNLPDAEVRAAMDRIVARITERGGEVRAVQPWGKRRLAYPIRRYREGLYGLVRFVLPGQRVQELKSALGITEEILRFLLVAALPTAQAEQTREEAREVSAEGGGGA